MRTDVQKAGLSWRDVEDWLEDLAVEVQGDVELTIRKAPPALGKPMGLTVALTATLVDRGGSVGATRRVAAGWPTYGNRTMPGLVLRLVHELRESILARPPKKRRQVRRFSYPAD